jgi:hypothetical protein
MKAAILKNKKGIGLIIVIFAVMVFAILGWTVTSLVSTDFEANVRNFESEKSLDVAESGLQEALMLIKNSDAAFDADSDQLNRTLPAGYGQYIVTRSTIGSTVTVVSTGYVPQQSNYGAMRRVSAVLNLNAFCRGAMIRHLLNWFDIDSGSNIDGEIMVVDRPGYSLDGYKGDNDSTHSEPEDMAVPGSGLRSTIPTDTGYPEIDMNFYYQDAGDWLGIFDLTKRWQPQPMEAAITNIQTFSSGTNWQRRLRITVSPSIFTTSPNPGHQGLLKCWDCGWPNYVFVRNKRNDAYLAQKWDYRNWGVIITRHDSSSVTLEFDSTADILNAVNIWHNNDQIRIGKRFFGDHDSFPYKFALEYLWYVKGDVLFDVRDENASFKGTSVIAEGDIVIRGDEEILMRCYRTTSPWFETFPNIATQTGNIYSPDAPSGGSGSAKANKRDFDGLIYSETGDIDFSYINGIAMMAANVTLHRYIKLKYTDRYVEGNGFSIGSSMIQWKEQ